MIVVGVRVGGANGLGITVTDTANNVYRLAVTKANSSDGHQLYLYYASNVAGGPATVTARVDASSASMRAVAAEYSGIALTNALDRTSGGVGTNAAPSSGNASTSQANELIFGVASSASQQTWTPALGWTAYDWPAGKLADEGRTVTSTGPVAARFSISSKDDWTAVVATFRAAQAAQ
jgi:hypothetical protein